MVEPYVCSIKLGEWQAQFDGNRRREMAASPEEVVIDSFMLQYLGAIAARRTVARVLRPHALTFAMWCVLYAAHRLVRETGDAVSQETIRKRTSLGKASVSRLICALLQRGLIDFSLDGGGPSYSVWATDRGVDLLEAIAPELASALPSGRSG